MTDVGGWTPPEATCCMMAAVLAQADGPVSLKSLSSQRQDSVMLCFVLMGRAMLGKAC